MLTPAVLGCPSDALRTRQARYKSFAMRRWIALAATAREPSAKARLLDRSALKLASGLGLPQPFFDVERAIDHRAHVTLSKLLGLSIT